MARLPFGRAAVALALALASLSVSQDGLRPPVAFGQQEPATIHFLQAMVGEVLLLDGAKLSSFWGRAEQSKKISIGSHVITASLLEGTNILGYTRIRRAGPVSVAFEAKPGVEYVLTTREGRTEAGGYQDWEPQVRLWIEGKAGNGTGYLSRTDVVSRPVVPSPAGTTGPADIGNAAAGPVRGADLVMRGHLYTVYSVAITPDGKLLASGSGDVRLWSLPDGKMLSTPFTGFTMSALAITPDGKTLAVGYFGNASYEVRLLSLPDGGLLKIIKGFHNGVTSLAISPNGEMLAAGSIDETVRLFSLPEGDLLATLKEKNSDGVRSLAISPDGKVLASGYEDGTVRLWSLPDGALLAAMKEHKQSVRALAITPDGKMLATGSRDATIKLWSLPAGRLLSTLEGHQLPVNAMGITPDGQTLISGSSDQSVKFWSLPDGHLKTTWAMPSHADALVISPDGKSMACGLWDDTVRRWTLP